MTGNDVFNSLWLLIMMPGSMIAIYIALLVTSFIRDAQFPALRQFKWHERDDFSRGYGWQEWFAWRPVRTVAGELIWWDTVYRQVGNTYVDYDELTWYFYGTVLDVLKDTKQ